MGFSNPVRYPGASGTFSFVVLSRYLCCMAHSVLDAHRSITGDTDW